MDYLGATDPKNCGVSILSNDFLSIKKHISAIYSSGLVKYTKFSFINCI